VEKAEDGMAGSFWESVGKFKLTSRDWVASFLSLSLGGRVEKEEDGMSSKGWVPEEDKTDRWTLGGVSPDCIA